jgi:hypothetical protein
MHPNNLETLAALHRQELAREADQAALASSATRPRRDSLGSRARSRRIRTSLWALQRFVLALRAVDRRISKVVAELDGR